MKKYCPSEAKEKIQRYCAYQERAHQEVRGKLYEYGLSQNEIEEIITGLIVDGFLNEERFAKAFAGGKFRMKKWGRNKIAHALEAKGLSANCIKAGLNEIDNTDYESTIAAFLKKEIEKEDNENVYRRRDKISRAAILKGYEPDLVWKFLKELLPD